LAGVAERLLVDLLVADPDLATPDDEQGCSHKRDNDGYHSEAPHRLTD
jgi:hypothetical protein